MPCRRNFMPVQKRETPAKAAENVAQAAAQQQQEARESLVKLQQRMQKDAPEGRRNPFLAFSEGAEVGGADDDCSGVALAFCLKPSC